ncbi:MAG: NeuD/PglB/VioB family sugar acetyltransferase [Methylomonas sp.]|nr:NeuD/PglB/VioB family sugar acetyltransferase [Methylomonas sp.]
MNIAVIGSGGHTRSLVNILKRYFVDPDIGIYDDSFTSFGEFIGGYPVLGRLERISRAAVVILSKGDNQIRKTLYDKYIEQVCIENLVHVNAFVEQDGEIGFSNQIFANAYINSSVRIGCNNIINTSAILEHEVVIGSHNHISVNAVLCGRVEIGSGCFIGASATIKDQIKICDNVVIGAGGVVVKNIDQPGVYAGVPCRKIK